MQTRSKSNIKGIDISKWQQGADFNKIKGAGYEVIIIKATEGVDFIDDAFETNYKGAVNVGLKVGMYHFMSDKTSPTTQAKDFWDVIKDKKFHVYPVLDIEKDTFGRSKKEVTDRCLEFLNTFKSISNMDCMVYTYTSFANEKLDSRLSKYKLWIAHYGVSTPGTNGVWNSWVGFQYTDKENVPGVKTPCDANKFTDEIFISRSDTPDKKPVDVSKNPGNKQLWETSISGIEVVNLQKELNNRGANLVVDGYFGDSTLKACITIKKGDSGNLVKLVQKRLMNKGYNLKPYNDDGSFGDTTLNAVKNMQKDAKLDVDGVVGQDTYRKLYSK